jgi:hypothetical protein
MEMSWEKKEEIKEIQENLYLLKVSKEREGNR